jgi:hypothetical protein
VGQERCADGVMVAPARARRMTMLPPAATASHVVPPSDLRATKGVKAMCALA